MFASTNLVIELGAVLWVLMGWRFVLAEVLGAFVLIGLLWWFARLFFPRDLEQQARRQVEGWGEKTGAATIPAMTHGDTARQMRSASLRGTGWPTRSSWIG